MLSRKKILILSLSIGCLSMIFFTGCGSKKKEVETEPVVVTQTVIETEAMTETEAPTEKETEKKITLKDIQMETGISSMGGQLKAQIKDSSGETTMEFAYIDNGAILAKSSSGDDRQIYCDESEGFFYKDGKWTEINEKRNFPWKYILSSNAELLENVSLSNKECYHVKTEADNPIPELNGLLEMAGYHEVFNGEMTIDYYVNPDSMKVVRMDVSMPFMAEKEGKAEKGTALFAYIVDSTITVSSVTKPEITVEEESDYFPGSINTDNNFYENEYFGIQVVGKDLLSFDGEKTEELAESYRNSNSVYEEEAYGEGEGIILNISSVKNGKSSKEDVLSKYLTDSGASSIQAAGTFEAGGLEFVRSEAMINDTKTYTYCAIFEDRAVIMTLYYQDKEKGESFSSHIFGTNENPFWEETEWILENKYKVKTPSGYAISETESGELYVCMKKSDSEVNTFALLKTSVDSEIQNQTTTSGDITKELVLSEDVQVGDKTMSYVVAKNKEKDLVYYTYVGLLPFEEDVIEYYIVSSGPNEDFKELFSTFAKATSVVDEGEPSSETQSEAVSEVQK